MDKQQWQLAPWRDSQPLMLPGSSLILRQRIPAAQCRGFIIAGHRQGQVRVEQQISRKKYILGSSKAPTFRSNDRFFFGSVIQSLGGQVILGITC
jgi:hypothetical protein